jgi:hypothetical protein
LRRYAPVLTRLSMIVASAFFNGGDRWSWSGATGSNDA